MYNNRDISWLSFNCEVLNQAKNEEIPLMERIRFLSIFSSNLDEFFRVRYPIIGAYAKLPEKLRHQVIHLKEKNLAELIQEEIDKQLNGFGSILNDSLIPALAEENIILYYNREIPADFAQELKGFFYSHILTFIQPVLIRRALSQDFFPESNRLYFLTSLLPEGSNQLKHAFINIPTEKLGRFHSINTGDGKQHIFFIDDIIRQHLPYIFSGYSIKSSYSFKITRDAELSLDEENLKGNILVELEKKLEKRERGLPSRLLYESGMPIVLQKLLATSFNLGDKQLFEGGRYHHLAHLSELPVKRDDLNFSKLPTVKHPHINGHTEIFSLIDERDLLMHFPYHSYNSVLIFFNQAAIDPDVKKIYVTIYRVAADSFIANSLISAAKNGKDVTVFVELKARFDEANNIHWSKEMKKAGVKIIYSIPGIKVHSKIALIKKKPKGGIEKSYAYIGTGNFNESTARFYTDHALLTASEELTSELELLFQSLSDRIKTDQKTARKFSHLLVSQNNMIEVFEKEIHQQIKRSKKGKKSLIRIKLNNLEDKGMIDLLYQAAKAGVRVQLIVRSICCIDPDYKTNYPNLSIKRIVDRYLEHSRIFIFGSGIEKKVYMGSADWMGRNLHGRIEVITPLKDESLATELEEYFNIQWDDTTRLKLLTENLSGSNSLQNKAFNNKASAQAGIYQYLNAAS